MIKRLLKGSRLVNTALFFALLLQVGNAAAFYNTKSAMGTNTNEVMEEDSSVPFVDLFRASLPFNHARPLTKGEVKFDKNGWPSYLGPGAQAGTRLISKLPANTIPQGYYTVLYDGQGKLAYGIDAALIESGKGRDVILIKPGKDQTYTVKLTITETNPKNPLRNIRVLPPGGICSDNPFQRVMNASQCRGSDYLAFERHYDKIIFNPDYLRFMRDYKVVRFMNMSGITRNPMSRWAERPHLKQASWGGPEGVRGLPLEIMIELANRLGADAWFTLPHAANDDFMRRYARMLKKGLNPDIKVYIEYSNETWNGIFTQHAYMKRMGLQYKLDNDPMQAAYKFYSKRSVTMFRIFEQEFGGTQRLIRVMGGLTGSKRMTQTMLSYNHAYRFTDAFAIAPYVFGEEPALRKAKSVAQVFEIMTNSKYRYSLPKVLEYVRNQVAMTSKFKVDLIAYEGGQHLVDWKTKSNNQHPNNLFYDANRHPQMAKIYKKLMDGWKLAGGKMFVHYTSPRIYQKFGSFGTKEYITQPDNEAPKHQAITSWIKKNPCWWVSCSGPVRRSQSRNLRQMSYLDTASTPAKTATRPRTPVAKPVAKKPIQSRPQTAQHQTPAQVAAQAAATKVAAHEIPHEAYRRGHAVVRMVKDMRNVWRSASSYRLRNVINGNISGKADLSAIWQASWDHQNLHIRVAVDDDHFNRDSGNVWNDDSIELYLDADSSRYANYDKRNDHHLIFRWQDPAASYGSHSSPHRLGLKFRMKKMDNSYVLEAHIPWTNLGITPTIGTRFGLDIHINDDDNGKQRDGKLSWKDRKDEAWRNPTMFGGVVLER